MLIRDLTPEDEKLFCLCLEDWSPELKEAGNHKAIWIDKMRDKGLRVKLAQDDNGTIGGMIQYIPIEHSFAEGKDLYFVNCIWVHGHKQGRGNFQKRGYGKALLKAAEEDAKALGAKGLVVWGLLLLPFFMRASWFKKQGYKVTDKLGMQALLWKPFTSEARPPHWIAQKKKPPLTPGKVTVSAFINGWCPAQNLTAERARRAALTFGDRVVFNVYNTFDRNTFLEWGISDALFIDDKTVTKGPPLTYNKILKHIENQVKKRL